MSSKASVELGVRTIVLLVLAVLVIILAAGFVTKVFLKANTLPSIMEISSLKVVPTEEHPIVIVPQTVRVSSGGSSSIMIGVYNSGPSDTIAIAPVTGSISCLRTDTGATTALSVQTLCSNIPETGTLAYKVIISGKSINPAGGIINAATGHYVCSIQPYIAIPNSCGYKLLGGATKQYIAQPLQFSLDVS